MLTSLLSAALAAVLSTAPSESPAGAGRAAVPIEGSSPAVPAGKGMWVWLPEETPQGGDAVAMVDQAVRHGMTHLYVRTGSSPRGFHGAGFLDEILPAAHAAGLRVYGWDFPYLFDPAADVARGVAAIRHEAPGGHRIDGFVPDVETPLEGVNLTAATAAAYAEGLRAAVGPDYPLVVAVPRPSPTMRRTYPYRSVVGPFDAVAPMVYWLHADAGEEMDMTARHLAEFGKPLVPIGQAYDAGPEGGPAGIPDRAAIHDFMAAADRAGSLGVSFWSWQHADEATWRAIADAPVFRPGVPTGGVRAAVAAVAGPVSGPVSGPLSGTGG